MPKPAPFKPQANQYSPAPAYLQIETTIKCNATCWFCPQHNTLRQPNYMETSVWKKIIDETRGLGITYRPFILNEPFADKRMPEIVEYIKQDSSARVEFNTNASMLTPKVTDKLLDIGVDVMRFSIDGLYRSTFDESRGISYDRVYDHAKYFLKANQNAQHQATTEVRMIKLADTEQEQQAFKTYWQQYQPDQIIFTDLYRYPWEGQTQSLNLPCLKIAKEMYFYVDGTATLCCWDTKGRQIIGDVKTQHTLDIWSGETLAHCRSLLDKGQRDQLALCQRCDAYETVDFSDWDGFDAKANQATQPTINIPIIAETKRFA